MSPRTIVLSLGAHGIAAVILLAVDAGPPSRTPTTIRIVSSPRSEAPPSAPPSAPPTAAPPTAPPSAAPTTRAAARPTRPKAAAARPSRPSRSTPSRTPYFSGLVLGNADGPGLAVGVTEDVARGPRDAQPQAEGGLAPAGPVATAPIPIEPARPKAPPCAVERPRILERPARIDYLEEARLAGAEGRLVLRLAIAGDGAVAAVELVRGVHPALDRAAIAAARTWRFAPARRCGRAIPGSFVTARRFELTD